MFTTDLSPKATRSIIGVVPFQVITALGITYLYSLINQLIIKKIFLLAVILLMILNFLIYFTNFHRNYTIYSSDFWGWQYGAREILAYFKSNEKFYDQMIMAPEFNEPEIFIEFYANNSCKNCIIGLPTTNLNFKKRQLFAVTPLFLRNHNSLNFATYKVIFFPINQLLFK